MYTESFHLLLKGLFVVTQWALEEVPGGLSQAGDALAMEP